eukprot:947747-Pyramimonas_sp.AAC.1
MDERPWGVGFRAFISARAFPLTLTALSRITLSICFFFSSITTALASSVAACARSSSRRLQMVQRFPCPTLRCTRMRFHESLYRFLNVDSLTCLVLES